VSLILRNPTTFGPVEWIGREGIGDDVRSLQPSRPVPFTPAMVRELDGYFGRMESFRPCISKQGG